MRFRSLLLMLLAAAAVLALAWGGWAVLRPADAGPLEAPAPIIVPDRGSDPAPGPSLTPGLPVPGSDVVPPPPVPDDDDDDDDPEDDDGPDDDDDDDDDD